MSSFLPSIAAFERRERSVDNLRNSQHLLFLKLPCHNLDADRTAVIQLGVIWGELVSRCNENQA